MYLTFNSKGSREKFVFPRPSEKTPRPPCALCEQSPPKTKRNMLNNLTNKNKNVAMPAKSLAMTIQLRTACL